MRCESATPASDAGTFRRAGLARATWFALRLRASPALPWHALGLAALAAVPVALAGETPSPMKEARSELARPEEPSQPDAHGVCLLWSGAGFEKIRIVAEGLNADRALKILLGDGHENLVVVGELPAGERGRIWTRTNAEGGELPFGVESVRALAERRIEIRDMDDRVVLRGRVPVLPAVGPEEPPPPPPADAPVITRSTMRRTDENGDREPKGVIVASRRAESSALRIELGRLAPETVLLVYIWAEGDLVLWGDPRTNGEGGASVERDTAKGQSLPLGAKSVGELAGRRIEVRDRDGRLLLYGEVPAAETAADEEPVREVETHEDAETGTDVRVEVDIRPERGREELRIVVRDLPRTSGAAKRARRTVEVRMDDGSGSLAPIANVRVNRGRATVRFDTRRNDELPFGVESVRDLSGRGFELSVGGVRVASGTLPRF